MWLKFKYKDKKVGICPRFFFGGEFQPQYRFCLLHVAAWRFSLCEGVGEDDLRLYGALH